MIWERLDRGFCNPEWLNNWPASHVNTLALATSDHSPITISICCNLNSLTRKKRNFKFENLWLLNKGCHKIIQEAWNDPCTGSSSYQVSYKLKSTATKLREWNKTNYGSISRSIKSLESELQQLQTKITDININDSNLREGELNIRRKLEHLLHCEQVLWTQRAKQHWISNGDQNTRSFIWQ